MQTTLDLPGVKKLRSGKVREVFDLGETLLFVATDRLSAFDVILPDPIPHKGAVLNQISAFWFETIRLRSKTTLLRQISRSSLRVATFRANSLAGRSMIVRKDQAAAGRMCRARLSRRFRLERLSGDAERLRASASRTVCSWLRNCRSRFSRLRPRARAGHDENIDWDECRRLLGDEMAEQGPRSEPANLLGREESTRRSAGSSSPTRNLSSALIGDDLLLIDECLTPDSSRFWPADQYALGKSPPSFDKQFVRDYLETLDWDKTPPAPRLPKEIIEKTSAKYREAYRRLTNHDLE